MESQLLFEDKLAPITSTIMFIETDPETATQFFMNWQNRLENERVREASWGVTQPSGTLEEVLLSLLPLTSVERRRSLFLPTRSSWTAYLDNGWQGTDASAIIFMSTQIKRKAVRAVAVPHTLFGKGTDTRGRYGAVMFELYSGKSEKANENLSRYVFAMNDGGSWHFDTYGDPLPFEVVEHYKAKRIKDRFTIEMLRDYLKHLDILAFEEDFYLPEQAYMVHCEGPMYPKTKTYSLAEARARF